MQIAARDSEGKAVWLYDWDCSVGYATWTEHRSKSLTDMDAQVLEDIKELSDWPLSNGELTISVKDRQLVDIDKEPVW